MGVGVAEGDAVPGVPFIEAGRHRGGVATWRSWRGRGGGWGFVGVTGRGDEGVVGVVAVAGVGRRGARAEDAGRLGAPVGEVRPRAPDAVAGGARTNARRR